MNTNENSQSSDGATEPHNAAKPSEEKLTVPKISSFVFTSTKIAQFHRSIAPDDALLTPPTKANSSPAGAVSCGLTPNQVQSHAFGAAHALPETSQFRRVTTEPVRHNRPSPIRSITILPETRPRMIGEDGKPLTGFKKYRASIETYLEAVGRTPKRKALISPSLSTPTGDPTSSTIVKDTPLSSPGPLGSPSPIQSPGLNSPTTPSLQYESDSYFHFKFPRKTPPCKS
ncbi:hypothetical protein CPB86DRAFT_791142 [Serendipita vermifera]|nr:hypothetical protein CPB86DRAFT_791142 [Serendipita vermifera]